MKMIIVIIKDHDADHLTQALTAGNFRVTRIASTGGFLRRGNATMMVGVEDDKVDQAIQVLHENCSPAVDPNQRRATLFVLDVARFDQI